MLFALALVVAVVLIVLARRRSRSSSSVRHFTETEQDGWYVIDVKPAPEPWSVPLLAYIVAGVMAVGITLIFVSPRRSEGGLLVIWLVSTVVFSALTWPLFRKTYLKKRNVQCGPFAVKIGAVRLAKGQHVSIHDYFAVHRRNTGAPGLDHIAYYVDLDVAGKNYVLVGGMTDNQSMAVFNQVNRRINGE